MVRLISLDTDLHLLTTAFRDLGDSLNGRKSTKDLEHLCRGLKNWLNVAFGAGFKDLGKTFPIGQQADAHSCGICVVNAIEHAMFGVPLFTDGDRYRLRIQYFVEAVKHLLNNVGIAFHARKKSHSRLFFSLPQPCVRTPQDQRTCRAKESTNSRELWMGLRREWKTKEWRVMGATVLMTLVKLLGSFAQAWVELTPTKGKTLNTVFPGLGRGFTPC